MRIRVRILNTSLKGLQFESDKETIRVGRSPENDLVLAEHSVSRFHALVSVRDGQIAVEDLGSRNQTKIDGQAISAPTAVEGAGNIVSFGDVLAEISLHGTESAAADSAEVTLPQAALAAVAQRDSGAAQTAGPLAGAIPQGWLVVPQQGRVPAGRPAEEVLDRYLWPVLALVLGLATAGLMTALFLTRSGTGEVPQTELGASLRVGEDKVVQVPKGFVHNPAVEDPGVVQVSRPLNLDLAVQLTGRSVGLTTVTLYNEAGQRLYLHAKVLPRERRQVAEIFPAGSLTEQQRTQLARQKMRLAEVLRDQNDPYGALQQYEAAAALLEPFAHNPPEEYLQARKWREALARHIQDRYEQLALEMGDLMRDGDKRMALERLAEIKELIRDEQDVRWQNADLLFRLLDSIIETEKKRVRRGL